MGPIEPDHNKGLITFMVIILSGFHCISIWLYSSEFITELDFCETFSSYKLSPGKNWFKNYEQLHFSNKSFEMCIF